MSVTGICLVSCLYIICRPMQLHGNKRRAPRGFENVELCASGLRGGHAPAPLNTSTAASLLYNVVVWEAAWRQRNDRYVILPEWQSRQQGLNIVTDA